MRTVASGAPDPTAEAPAPLRRRVRSGHPGPVVLDVSDHGLEAQQPAMRAAVAEAERRRVPLVVLHARGALRPRRGAEHLDERHARYLVGLAAHRVRELAEVGTLVTAVHSPSHPVWALLTASRSSSLLVLQVGDERTRHPGEPGPVVRAVVRESACPVLVLPAGVSAADGHGVVVGVEGRRRGQTCVRVALDEAWRADVPLLAVHAWGEGGAEPPAVPGDLAVGRLAAQGILDEALEDVPGEFPLLPLRRTVVRGTPVDVLRACAREAALLVVARTSERSSDLHTLGSTTRSLMRQSPCPLVVTPPVGPPSRDADDDLVDILRAGPAAS